MKRYVALLRGINVGGNSTISMTKLKNVFEKIGFVHVRTYINSGNVIFDTDMSNTTEIVTLIEKAIHKEFKFPVRVVIRDKDNIKKLYSKLSKEWNNAEQKTDVLFLWDEFDSKKTIALIASNPDIDTLRYVAGAIIWNIDRSNYTKSGMRKFIGTPVYKNMTARNINTVRKLYELMNDK